MCIERERERERESANATVGKCAFHRSDTLASECTRALFFCVREFLSQILTSVGPQPQFSVALVLIFWTKKNN